LISQDTVNYGNDLALKDGLAQLLNSIADVKGVEWVRFLYCYPTGISEELLRVMAERENVCKYFDIPLQHTSRDVLARMRRGGGRDAYEKMFERIRARVPDVALRTTFIVGFPGETESDFEELLGFVRNVEFDNVGVFAYSDEEHSAAYDLDGKVNHKIAKQRERRLMKEQARISKRKNKKLIGSQLRVLLEGRSKQTDLLLEGRLESQAPEIDGSVLINDLPEGRDVRPGDFVTVEITQATEYDLVGHVI
jgi:ribosomal protein S12 methylthiotransferase